MRALTLACLSGVCIAAGPTAWAERPTAPSRWSRLEGVARLSLEANVVQLAGKGYLVAGQGQFCSLWTRDFAHSARALALMGHADVVRNQIDALMAARRTRDGLVPRMLDSVRPAWVRVLRRALADMTGLPIPELPLTADLKPEYVGEHQTPAADGNLLIWLAARAVTEVTGDPGWWQSHAAEWPTLLEYARGLTRGGPLPLQPRFSDWQDSVKRDSRTLYLGLLYWQVIARGGAGEERDWEAERVRLALEGEFFEPASGVYRSTDQGPQVSLDGNLWALDWGYARGGSAGALYRHLTEHPLYAFTGDDLPSILTLPDYPSQEVSWTVKAVGLGHYHDRLVWSHQLGLAARVARCLGDDRRADALLDRLQEMAIRDQAIAEIYLPEPGFPLFLKKTYQSEVPFSWGAAQVWLASVARRGDPLTCPGQF